MKMNNSDNNNMRAMHHGAWGPKKMLTNSNECFQTMGLGHRINVNTDLVKGANKQRNTDYVYLLTSIATPPRTPVFSQVTVKSSQYSLNGSVRPDKLSPV